jgi:hypothetical protein
MAFEKLSNNPYTCTLPRLDALKEQKNCTIAKHAFNSIPSCTCNLVYRNFMPGCELAKTNTHGVRLNSIPCETLLIYIPELRLLLFQPSIYQTLNSCHEARICSIIPWIIIPIYKYHDPFLPVNPVLCVCRTIPIYTPLPPALSTTF